MNTVTNTPLPGARTVGDILAGLTAVNAASTSEHDTVAAAVTAELDQLHLQARIVGVSATTVTVEADPTTAHLLAPARDQLVAAAASVTGTITTVIIRSRRKARR